MGLLDSGRVLGQSRVTALVHAPDGCRLTRRDVGGRPLRFRAVDPGQRTEAEAAAFRRLLEHLRERADVQNMDLMDTAGFCRNCLSRWYAEAAAERGSGALEGGCARDRLRHALRGVEGSPPGRATRQGRPLSPRGLAVTVAVIALTGTGASLSGCGRSESPDRDQKADTSNLDGDRDVVLTPESVDPAAARRAAEVGTKSRARVVELRGVGEPKTYAERRRSREPRSAHGRRGEALSSGRRGSSSPSSSASSAPPPTCRPGHAPACCPTARRLRPRTHPSRSSG